jgi:hypothetical protein
VKRQDQIVRLRTEGVAGRLPPLPMSQPSQPFPLSR